MWFPYLGDVENDAINMGVHIYIFDFLFSFPLGLYPEVESLDASSQMLFLSKRFTPPPVVGELIPPSALGDH